MKTIPQSVLRRISPVEVDRGSSSQIAVVPPLFEGLRDLQDADALTDIRQRLDMRQQFLVETVASRRRA